MNTSLQLILALGILILAAKAAGLVSTRLRQPAVLGELIIGLLLGPSFLNLFGLPLFESGHSQEIIMELAEIGVIFLMFMAGLEVDLEEMRHAGRVAFLAGTSGVVVPLLLGALISLPFGYPLQESLFIGLILTATSVSISAQTLFELGMLKTREGLALLGAAVVDDVLVILALSFFLAFATGGGAGPAGLALVILRVLLFSAVAIAVGKWLLEPLTRRVANLPISEGVIAWVIVSTLLFAFAAEVVGQLAAITGAFLAGIFFGRSALRQDISRGMHTLTYALFVPLFLVSIGLQADIRTVGQSGAVFVLALTLIAVASKIIGAGLGARLAGYANRSALRVGVGMVSRGEVGLIVAGIELQEKLIDEAIFSGVVVMVLLTTLVTPLLLRWAFAGGKEESDEQPVDAGGG